MVPDVQQAAGEAEHDQRRLPQRPAEQRQPQADHDDADVLDAVVGEQPLQIVLAERKGDAEHGRDRRRAEQQPAPPQRRVAAAATSIRTKP